jgi:hypothetical protein
MITSMIRRTVLALGAAALVAGIAGGPARADDDDWHHGRGRDHHEREWHEREWHEHEWRDWCLNHPGAYAYPGYYCPVPVPPPIVYAPPPAVIYAPPPAVIYVPPPRPAIEIEIPVHIR